MVLFFAWPEPVPVAQPPVNGRLPMLAVPDHYLLRLTVLPDQPAFRGEVEIGLQLHEPARSLYLHGRDLTVHTVEVRREGKEPISGSYQQVTPLGLARVDFSETIAAGFLTLVLHFDGRYTQTTEGLGRIQVGDDWYAFSQFHPIEARRVFPGFDEPQFKATVELEVISWRKDTVIGNSLPSETRLLPDELKLTHFNRTPRLPTFLINISVGPFDVVNGPLLPASDVRDHPLLVRAISTHGEGHRSRFALDHTAAMLTAFEQYFAIPFPFEKLDLIAVPNSSSGVLESAGAINFLDQLMLLDGNASIAEQQKFISYHAHALAHQWFGNLVTMPWWDDLWMNEGFADWLGFEIAAQSHPDYPLLQAMNQQLETAMRRDGRSPLALVAQPISREEEVQSTFNTLVYDKAMGLLRMYQRYLGHEQFRQGLRNYFARHAFGNAGANELFRTLGDSVADPVISLSLDSFLRQPGLPELRLQQACVTDDLQLTLHQRAYTPAGSKPGEQLWHVPVCLRTPDTGHQSCRILNDRELVWSPGWRCDQLVIPNAGGAGYYRWQTEPQHRQQLVAALPQLPRAEAMDIVANFNSAFRAGSLSAAELFDALPTLARHPDPGVLDSTLESWHYLLNLLTTEKARDSWQQRLQTFFAAATIADPGNNARQIFRALDLHDGRVIDAHRKQHQLALQALVANKPFSGQQDALAVALALADEPALLASVQQLLLREDRNDRRAPLVQALAWQTNPVLIPGLQQLLLAPELRIHERWTLLQASLMTPSLQVQQWQWLQDHFDQVLPLLPDYRQSQLPAMAEALCDDGRWQAIQLFLRQHTEKLALTESILASTGSHVRECLALRQRLAASDKETAKP